jgi:hypothetical protein
MSDYDENWLDALRDEWAESWTPGMLREITAVLIPTRTALFRRDGETLWIHAYTAPRMVTLTYPGLVREVHVGPRADLGDAFHSLCSDAAGNGWERQAGIYVWSGDPWDHKSVLDEGPTF